MAREFRTTTFRMTPELQREVLAETPRSAAKDPKEGLSSGRSDIGPAPGLDPRRFNPGSLIPAGPPTDLNEAIIKRGVGWNRKLGWRTSQFRCARPVVAAV